MDQTSDSAPRRMRVLLNVAMAGWFLVLAIWLPGKILSRTAPKGMTPHDFVPIVQMYCVPVVRAIKTYQQTHGHMPASLADLGLPPARLYNIGPGHHRIDSAHLYSYWVSGMYSHEITYDFTPGHEGWFIHGAFANGPLPIPPVTLAATPTTGP